MAFWSSSRNAGLVISLILVCCLGTFADALCETNRSDFSCAPPFCDPVFRPICEDVEAHKVDKTRFCYFNRAHRSLCTPIPNDYNTAEKSIIIIHGFEVKLNGMKFLLHLIKELLKYRNYNIVLVDWTASNGNKFSSYPQAVSNARAVGALTACRMIDFQQQNPGFSFGDCHIIGHGLGAHIAGYIGKILRGLGRITALNPAGPYFQDCNSEVSLGPNDAHFVDALHTNGACSALDGYGTCRTVGHIDGYPNGGSLQPGCPKNDPPIHAQLPVGKSFNICSHRRVVYLYAESINSKTCPFVGQLCRSWRRYQCGRCKENTRVTLGFHAKKHSGRYEGKKFYLSTNAYPPYCKRN